MAEGLLAGGVLPVIKHMPGQGRAALDSHLELPRVEAPAAELAADFAPFRALADLPMAMTAHVVYAALDPEAPATQSARVIRLIREEIGFGGLLMTDDLSMKALRGRLRRAGGAGARRRLRHGAALQRRRRPRWRRWRRRRRGSRGASLARAEAALALRGARGRGGRRRRWRPSSRRSGGGRMPEDFFDAAATAERLAAEALVVDLDGFEGPLDLLLALARSQKVDLRRISILRLAEQYLGFVEAAKRLRIELAADYLVMAAWLAFLKSRLLLPPDPAEEGPSADEMAAHLAFQLQRLEAMRDAAARLMARDQLGRDVFARGEEETVTTRAAHGLDREPDRADARLCPDPDQGRLPAAAPRTRAGASPWSRRSSGCAGCSGPWSAGPSSSAWLPEEWKDAPERRRSATAGSFAAALELVKAGRLELRQEGAFRPIYLKAVEQGEARMNVERRRSSSPRAPARCRCPSRSAWSRRCCSRAARR